MQHVKFALKVLMIKLFHVIQDVVMCLLNHNASTTIKNDEGRRASQVACDPRIKDVLEGKFVLG